MDTGFASWRQLYARWPHCGPPPALGSAEEYRGLVEELIASGVIDDESNLYWGIRPSARYPTVEFRVTVRCTTGDLAG